MPSREARTDGFEDTKLIKNRQILASGSKGQQIASLMQREVARQRRDGGIVKVEMRIKTIPHPTPSGAFGPRDKKSRDGI